MATIDSKEFVDNIIRNNGFYNGDDDNTYGDNPRVIKVVEYTNQFGNVTWAILFENDDPNKYAPSMFVSNPKTIWEYKK